MRRAKRKFLDRKRRTRRQKRREVRKEGGSSKTFVAPLDPSSLSQDIQAGDGETRGR